MALKLQKYPQNGVLSNSHIKKSKKTVTFSNFMCITPLKGEKHFMRQSDEELMKACQLGDKLAMKQIFQRNKVRIFNFCYSLLGNRADAEEIAADVFLTLIKNKHSYDTNRTFSTWIFTIAKNLCFNRISKRKQSVFMWFSNQDNNDFESWDVPDNKDDSSESLAKKERAQHVRKAIAKLPIEQRAAIELRQYQKFSYIEISQSLNCSLDKVKILIFRAKENLKKELASFIKEEQL